MAKYILVSKEPRWLIRIGAVFAPLALVALIPVKADYLQMWDLPLYSLGMIGIGTLIRASQKIGWRISLVDNVLYYSKFNLYSSWKSRRAQEFAIAVGNMSKVEWDGNDFVVHYQPGKQHRFNTTGLDGDAEMRLQQIKEKLEVSMNRSDEEEVHHSGRL